MAEALTEPDLPLPLLTTGKVRSLYEIPDSSNLLFVASDRISSFDVVLKNGIPNKGRLLTEMSAFWFDHFKQSLPHLKTHFVTLDLPAPISDDATITKRYQGRSMQVQRLEVLPLESIVRGYITGSAWSEYQRSGTVHGLSMPTDLQLSQKLPEPIWTPSTKAPAGEKDENISPAKAAELVGPEIAKKVEQLSLAIYNAAAAHAASNGIIIADTKFEFAIDRANNEIILIDEVLTPDSSRFWPASDYELGKEQRSLDKQYLRDWLISNGLKGKEGVEMPEDVIQRTKAGYEEAFERLVGRKS